MSRNDWIKYIGTVSEHFDSREHYYRVKKQPTDDVSLDDEEGLFAFLAVHGYVGESGHCGHEHDCCGCWFSMSPVVVGQEDNYWLVKVNSYQNV